MPVLELIPRSNGIEVSVEVQRNMPGAPRRTSRNNKNIADEGSYSLSRRSIEHNNYKICPKDHPVTALFLKGSDGRYIILTLSSLERDVRWKFLLPFSIPVQGSGERNHLGSGSRVNVDGLEPVSPPPVSLVHVDLQKEQMIDVPESTGFAKSWVANSSSRANVLKQSHNRNKQTTSLKNSSSTGLANCFISNNSSGLVSNASNAAVSDVPVGNILEVDKLVKRSSRKKGKKKGKQYKISLCKKGSIASEAVCEEITCNMSIFETSVDGDPSCSSDCVSENNLSEKAPILSVQATIERDDSEENSSDILNPSTTSMTCTSYSNEMDEPESVTSVSEDFSVEDFSYNQLVMDESSGHLTNSSSTGETSEIILSTFCGDVTNVYLKQSNNGNISSDDPSGHHKAHRFDSPLVGWNSGNNVAGGGGAVETRTCIKEDKKFSSPEGGQHSRFSSPEGGMVLGSSSKISGLHCESANFCDIGTEIANNCRISSTYWQKDTVDTDSSNERTHCGSQASSSNAFHPVILNKRGRHCRKVSGCSNGMHRFGSLNMHGRTGQDINHSVWQKVQKNDAEECICRPKNVNPVSSQFDVASQGSEIRGRSDAFVWLRQNENGKSCTYTCVDEMATQTDTFSVASNVVDSNKFLSKSDDGKLEHNFPEKLKRKPGPVPKQEINHYSRRGAHTGKTNMTRVSEILVQQKEAPGISSHVNYHKIHTNGLKTPCNSDIQSVGFTPSDRTDFCRSEPKKQTHTDETAPLGNICSKVCDTTVHAAQTQISSLSRTFVSLDKTCMREVLSDGSSSKFSKDSHLNVHHLADNEGTGCVKLDTEGLHAEHSKQNQNSGSVLQKWIPVGKKDATLFNTRHIDTSETSILDGLVSDRWISESLEVEQLNSISRLFLPLTGSGVACLSPSSDNLDCSAHEDDGLTHKLRSPRHVLKEQNGFHAESNCELTQETKDHSISGFETDLSKIIQVVNDAHRLQIASEGVERATGSPVAEFERLLHFASPVLGQLYSLRNCKSCSRDRLIGDSMCQHQIPNISLGNLWQWYEKPGTYGLEVKAEGYHSSKRMDNGRFEFRAYFVPYLSAVQLFGKSRSSMCTNNGNSSSNGEVKKACEVGKMPKSKLSTLPIFSLLLPQPHKQTDTNYVDSPSSSPSVENSNKSDSSRSPDEGVLLFEYFESDQPQQRRPLFEKIQELVRGNAFSNSQIFGDPSKLECLDLHDLHPASWYSVAWYPIYRIPDGNLRAAFLTYHSLGHFIHRSASSNFSSGVTCIVSPVVGLQTYNAKGECWFQQRGLKSKAVQTEEASLLNPSEILKERLRTLEQTASVMARASIRKGDLTSVNKQPDYEFFLSRGRQMGISF